MKNFTKLLIAAVGSIVCLFIAAVTLIIAFVDGFVICGIFEIIFIVMLVLLIGFIFYTMLYSKKFNKGYRDEIVTEAQDSEDKSEDNK